MVRKDGEWLHCLFRWFTFYSKTKLYTVTKHDKTRLPQGTRLSTPGDRLHKHRQAFPWHPSQSTRGQTTNMTDKSSHGTHFKVHHETDYTTHKAFPWHSSQSIQGDRQHQDGQSFPWSPSRSTRRHTTNMQTSLPLVPLSKYQGTDYTKTDKSSPGVLLGAPGDRLQICRQAFPWYPSRSTKGQTIPGT